jgi:hypothetical protein
MTGGTIKISLYSTVEYTSEEPASPQTSSVSSSSSRVRVAAGKQQPQHACRRGG